MSLLPAVALSLVFAGPPPTVDHTTACGRWTVDRNAGFEGGETAAVLDCGTGDGTWRPFHIGCAGGRIAIRLAPRRDEVLDGRIAEATVVLLFDGPIPEAVVTARYQAAIPDFAAYLAPAAAADLLAGLRGGRTVTLKLGSATEVYPLAGSAAAVGEIAAACGVG